MGLSKREHIAALMMQAIVQADSEAYHRGDGTNPVSVSDYIARDAVKLADSLIAELENTENNSAIELC